MHCYLPGCCLFPLSCLIIISGLVYAILFGRMTGFYSVAVGMLFVISGCFGIFSSCWRSYMSSALFTLTLSVSSIIAVAVNVFGFLLPQYVFLLNETEDALQLFDFTIKPNTYWFGIALFYLTLIHIPFLSFSICNMCTVNSVIHRKQKRKQKMEEKAKRKEGFFLYRGNTLKNRIRPEEFAKIRAELNQAVRSSYTSSSSNRNTSPNTTTSTTKNDVEIELNTHLD